MMHFEGEALLIDGREYVGTVVVETEVSNASFDHAFGTEHVIDIIHEAILFLTKGPVAGAEYLNDRARPALAGWLASNRARVEKAFDLACKRAE